MDNVPTLYFNIPPTSQDIHDNFDQDEFERILPYKFVTVDAPNDVFRQIPINPHNRQPNASYFFVSRSWANKYRLGSRIVSKPHAFLRISTSDTNFGHDVFINEYILVTIRRQSGIIAHVPLYIIKGLPFQIYYGDDARYNFSPAEEYHCTGDVYPLDDIHHFSTGFRLPGANKINNNDSDYDSDNDNNSDCNYSDNDNNSNCNYSDNDNNSYYDDSDNDSNSYYNDSDNDNNSYYDNSDSNDNNSYDDDDDDDNDDDDDDDDNDDPRDNCSMYRSDDEYDYYQSNVASHLYDVANSIGTIIKLPSAMKPVSFDDFGITNDQIAALEPRLTTVPSEHVNFVRDEIKRFLRNEYISKLGRRAQRGLQVSLCPIYDTNDELILTINASSINALITKPPSSDIYGTPIPLEYQLRNIDVNHYGFISSFKIYDIPWIVPFSIPHGLLYFTFDHAYYSIDTLPGGIKYTSYIVDYILRTVLSPSYRHYYEDNVKNNNNINRKRQKKNTAPYIPNYSLIIHSNTIVLVSPTRQQHHDDINFILHTLSSYNIPFDPDDADMYYTSMDILGTNIGPYGRNIISERIREYKRFIHKTSLPVINKTQLLSIIGKFNYNREYFYNMSLCLSQLHYISTSDGDNTNNEYSDDTKKVIQHNIEYIIHDELSSRYTLRYIDHKGQYCISINISDCTIACRLHNYHRHEKTWYVVSCYSHILSKNEQQMYTLHRCVLYGLYLAVRYWKKDLRSRHNQNSYKFCIYTNITSFQLDFSLPLQEIALMRKIFKIIPDIQICYGHEPINLK